MKVKVTVLLYKNAQLINFPFYPMISKFYTKLVLKAITVYKN